MTETSKRLGELEYVWVDSDDALEQFSHQWLNEPYIILDTEFERSSTYFAIAGLIQVASNHTTYLIDPTVLSGLSPLAKILENPDVAVVMHSMSEDVDLLLHLCECAITSVFDTQVAAAFLGKGTSVGYQRLVEMVLGIELDKGETRSDWLKRPLSAKQLQYAAADVVYLEDIYHILRNELAQSPWLVAVEEECRRQVNAIVEAAKPSSQAYLRVRGAWDLQPENQSVLRELVIWRDATAIEANVPKSWVFSDPQLIEIARVLPTNTGFLFKLPKVKPKSVKRFGEQLLDQVASANTDPLPRSELIPRPIKGKELEFYKKIKKIVQVCAEKAGLDPQLIAGRKQMESWVIHFLRHGQRSMPAILEGWRKDLVEEPLTELVIGTFETKAR